MRIIFNLMSCGLGNNGGSHTIVRSSNALTELGHSVFLIDLISCKHTWTRLNSKHIVVKNFDQVPDSDFVIATGYTTVDSTISLPPRCGKKVHWMRAWETWKLQESEIIKRILYAGTIKLVNSIWLQKKLSSLGFKSEIIRPGYDFDEVYPLNIRSNKEIVIGALYNEGKKRRSKRTQWCFESISFLKKKHRNIRFQMFGSEGVPKSGLVDKFVRSPSSKDKNTFYNECHIWLAPTELEGLHIPPAEAMLAECCIVGTNSPMSGMQDYLEHGKTGLVSNNTIESFIKSIDSLILNEKTRKSLAVNGRQKVLELGSRQNNMKGMIDFLSKQ
jgi:glycosyltransferase involved in cell wall biosynthesis